MTSLVAGRAWCRVVITNHWDEKLRCQLLNEEGEERASAIYNDTHSLSTSTPMRIWQKAGLDSQAVKEATPVSWMYTGVYFTQEYLFKMKKVNSPACACDGFIIENLPHFVLHCKLYRTIREEYIPKYILLNKNIPTICDSATLLLIFNLDPLSAKLPEMVTTNWSSVQDVYKLSRKFIFRMHLKRENFYSETDN